MYVQLFQSDIDQKWHWSLRDDKHASVADATHSFMSREEALHSILLAIEGMAAARIYDGSKDAWL
ncbi:MAG TPA: hypothetical protein VKP65_18665 [Rhodothermales bacterium]|nr:hypothetical protein [Rhodothermales bacterium]